jgi:uncharacterized membrane protein (DUF485 family)
MTTETGSSGDPPATEKVTVQKDEATPPTEAVGDRQDDQATYVRVAASEEFGELRKSLRGFVFPMTVAFLVWYLLYVVLSAYARDFMATKVVGNLNIAFVFGVLQFLSTFLIAWAYARYASRRLDPAADRLRERVEGETDTAGGDR